MSETKATGVGAGEEVVNEEVVDAVVSEEVGKPRKASWRAKRRLKAGNKTILLPENVGTLDEIFKILREEDALFNQMLGTLIEAAALFATLDGLVLAIGLASLAFPIPAHSILQHFQALWFPKPAKISLTHQSGAVLALVGEGLVLLVTTGYLMLYPVVRVLRSQRQYFRQGITYLLAPASDKREILQGIVNHRTPLTTMAILVVGVGLPFVLLIFAAITSLYSVLLHIPFGT